MILDPLSPQTLRRNPQLAAVDLLANLADVTIVALLAAHPVLQSDFRNDPEPPIERVAHRVIEQLTAMLDDLDRYRRLLHDLERLDTVSEHDIDIDF